MLKLVQTEYGHFDLAVIEATEDAGKARAKTAVYAALFTDQIAPADRVEDGENRRGWWYDETLGTGLWYVRRQALTESAKRETIRMIREALVNTEGMTDIAVTELSDQRNVSLLVLDIRGAYDGVEFHTEFKNSLIQKSIIPPKVIDSIWDVEWDAEWANGSANFSVWNIEWDVDWVN